jgi:hypothetical protein
MKTSLKNAGCQQENLATETNEIMDESRRRAGEGGYPKIFTTENTERSLANLSEA